MTTSVPEVDVTAEDRATARERVAASTRGVIGGGTALVVSLAVAASAVARGLFPDLDGLAAAAVQAAIIMVLAAPPLWFVATRAKERGLADLTLTIARERVAIASARRREFDTRLANALDMTDDEAGCLDVARRALGAIDPDADAALLLADNSQAHLQLVVSAGDHPARACCPVESPHRCVAARRGQPQHFDDATELDACPKLLARDQLAMAATCVPVAIGGRTVGVLHVVSAPAGRLAPEDRELLSTLAKQLGARLGTHRLMAESQLQASTDPLTGLLNRRSVDDRIATLLTSGAGTGSAVMADLDHFKDLNDTYGHDTGDRALRVFAGALRTVVRPTDVIGRYGGEEFVLVLRDADEAAAREVCERIRTELAAACERAGTPPMTTSFGVAEIRADDDVAKLVARADAALYLAKREGRDRVESFRGLR
jgi:diguanylate cyclase (GGDEF)-like protein